jgi:hypothetical protein
LEQAHIDSQLQLSPKIRPAPKFHSYYTLNRTEEVLDVSSWVICLVNGKNWRVIWPRSGMGR